MENKYLPLRVDRELITLGQRNAQRLLALAKSSPISTFLADRAGTLLTLALWWWSAGGGREVSGSKYFSRAFMTNNILFLRATNSVANELKGVGGGQARP